MSTGLSSPLRIAVLISGGGTTLRNLIHKINAGTLPVEICVVVSTNPQARGLRFAAAENIPAVIVQRKDYGTIEAFSADVFAPCRQHRAALVVMAGFLKLVKIPDDFRGRVINIHPALIPKFCGAGFYGQRVHTAVLAAGESISGCTVHFVDDQFDHGPIILQKQVPVLPGDTPETLASRVFAAECEAYPEVIRLYAEGKIRLEGNRVVADQPADA